MEGWAPLSRGMTLRPSRPQEDTGSNYPVLQESLRQYVDRIFTVITKSGVSCPTVMCDIFFSLREAAAKRFQGEPARQN